jgi:hypothetical protein
MWGDSSCCWCCVGLGVAAAAAAVATAATQQLLLVLLLLVLLLLLLLAAEVKLPCRLLLMEQQQVGAMYSSRWLGRECLGGPPWLEGVAAVSSQQRDQGRVVQVVAAVSSQQRGQGGAVLGPAKSVCHAHSRRCSS